MIRILVFAGLITSYLACAGCSNAVYYYDTEKVSLGIEVRPNDPAAPINGNISAAQRVAIIVPSTDSGTNSETPPQDQQNDAADQLLSAAKDANAAVKDATTAPAEARTEATTRATEKMGQLRQAALAYEQSTDASGDALSVASSFRFKQYRIQSPDIFPRVTIDSALITGEPARIAANSNGQINNAIGALSGQSRPPSTVQMMVVLSTVFDGLVQSSNSGDANAKKLVDQLDAQAPNLPKSFPVTLYDYTKATNTLSVYNGASKAATLPAPAAGVHPFQSVIDYNTDLQHSSDSLKNAQTDFSGGSDIIVNEAAGNSIKLDQTATGKDLAASFFAQNIASDATAQQNIENIVNQSGIKKIIAQMFGLGTSKTP